MTDPLPEKICLSCGRTIVWRKKWERDWEDVKYCSQACKRNKPTGQDHALESAILALLQQRQRGASICPSEAAKAVGGEAWRPLMESARAAGRRLVARGQVFITQKGRAVDPSTARGPIRIRLQR